MKEFPDNLTPSQREFGQRQYRRFTWFNAISVTCLIENMLILYAIRNRLSDPAVAILASFMQLTMPFMILGKRLVARLGLTRTWGLCWGLRYLAGLIMVAAPFLACTPFPHSVSTAILAGSFGFFFFRAIGMMTFTPLLGEITTARDRGRFLSGNSLRASVGQLGSMLGVVLLLRNWDTIGAYQLIILTGCLVGFYAARVITTVPESRTPQKSAREPVRHSLKLLLETTRYRRLLAAWSAVLISIMLVNPFSMIALKNGYMVSDYNAVFFTLIGLIGGIVACLICSLISDHVGPRPILIVNMVGLIAVGLFWAFAPTHFIPLLVGFIFFVAGFCTANIGVGIAHYFLSVVPGPERVGVGLFMQMFTGAAAGIAGSAVGGGILHLLREASGEGLGVYQGYFRIVLIGLIPMFLLTYRLEKLKEWKIRNVLGLFFSFRDLRTLFVLNRLEKTVDYTDDIRDVERLGEIGSRLSEEALLGYLDSARLGVRNKSLQALQHIDFGKWTVEALMNELEQGEFTTASIAAEILGEHGIKKAIPALRRALHSKDFYLRGKSMIALVRLGDTRSYSEIREQFETSENPHIIIHGANALALMQDPDNLRVILEKVIAEDVPEPALDEVLTTLAALCGCENEFYQFLKEYNHDSKQGLAILFDVLGRRMCAEWVRRLRACVEAGMVAVDLGRILIEAAGLSSLRCAVDVEQFLLKTPAEKIYPKLAFCLALIFATEPAIQ